MIKRRWISCFALLMLLMMSACSGSPASKTEDNAQSGTEKANQNEGAEATPADNDSQDDGNTNATNQDGAGNNESQSPEDLTKETSTSEATATSKATKGKFPFTLQVDQQQSHVNGTSVFIESITFEDKYIKVQFEAVTNKDFVHLSDEFDPDVVLTDDTGLIYTYIRPEENRGLKIPRDGKLAGTLLFFGRLNPDAKQLTLEFNTEERDNAEANKKADYTNVPYFKFVIDLAQERG